MLLLKSTDHYPVILLCLGQISGTKHRLQPSVLQVLNVWAINHGNNVMVSIKAELQPEMTVRIAMDEINAMERQIKQTHARVKWIFFEIDNAD